MQMNNKNVLLTLDSKIIYCLVIAIVKKKNWQKIKPKKKKLNSYSLSMWNYSQAYVCNLLNRKIYIIIKYEQLKKSRVTKQNIDHFWLDPQTLHNKHEQRTISNLWHLHSGHIQNTVSKLFA